MPSTELFRKAPEAPKTTHAAAIALNAPEPNVEDSWCWIHPHRVFHNCLTPIQGLNSTLWFLWAPVCLWAHTTQPHTNLKKKNKMCISQRTNYIIKFFPPHRSREREFRLSGLVASTFPHCTTSWVPLSLFLKYKNMELERWLSG